MSGFSTSWMASQKYMEQAMRQSDALRQNGLKGRWEVPNADVKTKAQKLLDKVGIDNISVTVEPPQ
jgi:filamentous hemagglutinin